MSTIITGRGVEVTRGDRVVLRNSDFSIPEASITAVIGPNGSGKSSLLHAITGLLPVTGDLSVLGGSPESARDQIAYVLQHLDLTPGVPMTVLDAVTMGRYSKKSWLSPLTAEDKQAVWDALEVLQIADLAKRQVSQLSGGQRQRVFVAQALVQEHTVLMMDEPLTGLDIQSAQTIDRLIHEEPARGCSVIFTTHDLEEARAADNVILVSGYVVACGTPAEVLTPANLARAYGLGMLHPENTGNLGILDAGHEDVHQH